MTTDAMGFAAHLFDLDGVVTPTVDVHRRAWQETFDDFFHDRGEPPYREDEYFQSLDGRPRFDGVATLLAARGIELPWGEDSDESFDTICGIGNRKNQVFTEVLNRDGISAYPGTMRMLDELASRGTPLAIVSSSKNAESVLRVAGIRERFSTVIDGTAAEARHLPGKPAPDTYLAASSDLGVAPQQAVVLEDAESGVAAGAAGAFGYVIGVDRGAGQVALTEAGADIVVSDLGELLS